MRTSTAGDSEPVLFLLDMIKLTLSLCSGDLGPLVSLQPADNFQQSIQPSLKLVSSFVEQVSGSTFTLAEHVAPSFNLELKQVALGLGVKGHLCRLINNAECWSRVEHMGVTSIQVGHRCPLRIRCASSLHLSRSGYHQQVWSRRSLVNI